MVGVSSDYRPLGSCPMAKVALLQVGIGATGKHNKLALPGIGRVGLVVAAMMTSPAVSMQVWGARNSMFSVRLWHDYGSVFSSMTFQMIAKSMFTCNLSLFLGECI